jgi:hypothetical protein
MPKTVYKIIALGTIIPFAFFLALGRLPRTMIPNEPVIVNFQVTMLICIAVAFLGAYASRKLNWMNLNAMHGVIGAFLTGFLLFSIFHPWLVALAISLILAPVLYILITGPKNNFRKPSKDPQTGNPVVSDITVWDVMRGKYKPEDKIK